MIASKYDAGVSACFKAYDIRGAVPAEIDDEFVFKLGLASGFVFNPETVVIGHDARLSSPGFSQALVKGLASSGAKVSMLGLCGTEEIYYSAAYGNFDLGIMITGSHNPGNQNGFKFVLKDAIPVSSNNGLADLERIMRKLPKQKNRLQYNPTQINMRHDYISWLRNYAAPPVNGRPLRVLVNAGNGSAGPMLEELTQYLPFEFIKMNYEPDGHFPNGVPNPLLPECRSDTSKAVKATGADLGVAFDGDFDRCFFFDENGDFIEGYYLVGILAVAMLAGKSGQKVIHDPRLYWNTRDVVQKAGGVPIMGRTGHAFMKEKMRLENALYGGEMSSHHYFRDFAYCDSGMLTMLLILSWFSQSDKKLSEIVTERVETYPCSGEINFRVQNTASAMEDIWRKYSSRSAYQDRLDGINLEFDDWRFNLRPSNTESLLRLNVESKGNRNLMQEKTDEISSALRNF